MVDSGDIQVNKATRPPNLMELIVLWEWVAAWSSHILERAMRESNKEGDEK